MIICDNGEFINERAYQLRISNRSLLYGDGLFETMRLYQGKLLFGQEHFNRLKQSAKIVAITLPSEISSYRKMAYLSEKLAEENKGKNGSVKLLLYRNAGGKYIANSSAGSFFIQFYKMSEDLFPLQKKGLQLDVYLENKKALGSMSSLKSTSALLPVMAGNFAKKFKLDEAIILNSKNELCEGIGCNLFVIKGDEIFTPPLQSACLPGVMRSVVIELCSKNGILLKQKNMGIEDLERCDEMFMTNAISGIKWVGGYKERRFYSKKTRLLHKLLLAEYS